ncbi:hypothetical protein, conserved [Plasmodium gonderi]|uniref:Uncharacterized protein n=1 Tax=Plasmodium gonderi TaxID=77519 RepID=A0A1Y1JM44_PLAGO|nr:hypothetical protein, conserved [Plasmodium gonderi]GAW82277.1 hypothetical protein, conserved [Plasmodium gonderi]
MDEEVLKRLTNRELKKTILEKAKHILDERKSNTNEQNKYDKKNTIIENEEHCMGKHKLEMDTCSTVAREIFSDKENNPFYNIQDLSLKYLKMCEWNKLDYTNVEYELVISFMRTLNNELKYQLSLSNNENQEDKENSLLYQIAKMFIDKLIFYCTNPMACLTPNKNSDNILLGEELSAQILFFFKQIEENSHENFLLNICLSRIAESIFNFKPEPNEMASWVSRQALTDLIKILLGDSLKRYEQCIICLTDLIKQRHKKLSFMQVDNTVLIIEIIQYAIVYLSEQKYNTTYSSFEYEEWFKSFTDLLRTLKSSEWKIFFNQLIVAETFLYEKRAENTNKEFNNYYKQQLNIWRHKNTSYSKWFKIEMPFSLSLLK